MNIWKMIGELFALGIFYNILCGLFNFKMGGSFIGTIGSLAVLALCFFLFYKSNFSKPTNKPGVPLPSKKKQKKLKGNADVRENMPEKTPSRKPVASRNSRIYSDGEIHSISSARDAIDHTRPKAFRSEIRLMKSQLDRMEQKDGQLEQLLQETFGGSKISYQKFASTVDSVQELFYDNITRALNRIAIFDEEGYKTIFDRHKEYTNAIEPYNENIRYVEKAVDENDKILNSMDRLMLEVAQINESNKSIEELPAMEEISELIEQTKLYKRQH